MILFALKNIDQFRSDAHLSFSKEKTKQTEYESAAENST